MIDSLTVQAQAVKLDLLIIHFQFFADALTVKREEVKRIFTDADIL